MNTRQKALVLEVVQSNCDHMTAEKIYTAAKKRMPQIAMGTVYRNLSMLAAEGQVLKLEMPSGPDRYDGCVRPHEHLFCDRCGRVVDIFCGDLTAAIEAATGRKLHSYRLSLHGICDDCAAQGKENRT